MAGLRAVFLDAGNTLLALDYEEIAACFRAAGHRQVTAEAVRVAEQRARPGSTATWGQPRPRRPTPSGSTSAT